MDDAGVEALRAPDVITGFEEAPIVMETQKFPINAPKPIVTQLYAAPEGASVASPVVCTPTGEAVSFSTPPAHPLDTASPLSILYLSCLDSIIWLGAKRPLQVRAERTCPLIQLFRVMPT